MEEQASQPQELHPCPGCGRKFLAERLQVHLRSCDKSKKLTSHGPAYDNSAFLAKLDAEMEKELKHSTYKTSKKEKVDPNKAFLEKLEKEMQNEEQSSKYKPSQPKKKEVVDSNKAFMQKLEQEMEKEQQNPSYKQPTQKKRTSKKEDNNDAFMQKLEKEMEKEQQNPSYKQPTQKKRTSTKEDNQQDFMQKLEKEIEKEQQNPSYKQTVPKKRTSKKEDNNDAFMQKLEQEMEKDSKNPYISSSEQKKKLSQNNNPQDSNKAFIDKLEKEMQKEDTYKPSERKKPIKPDYKKDFESKINSELEKEKSSKTLSKQLLCYICYRPFPITSYASHIKQCENSWRRNNLGKDPNSLKPDKFDETITHISTLTSEQIDKYNEDILNNKDKMSFVPCENCARNIQQCKMEEHLKTCKPMTHTQPKKQGNSSNSSNAQFKQGNYDLNKMIQEQSNPNEPQELVQCDKCGRKFLPDRLTVHSRGCKGKK